VSPRATVELTDTTPPGSPKQYAYGSQGEIFVVMSFKCSVFGHAYGDSEIEREREEDGSEVVTTIQERQTCTRCGETRVVSENKEVTTLETAADIVGDDLAGDTSEGPTPDADGTADEGETRASHSVADETPVERETDPDPEPETVGVDESVDAAEVVEAEPTTDPDPAPDPDPETDDGVILDDEEDDEPEREPGAWPDEPDDGEDQWEPETEVDPTPDEQVEEVGSAVTVPDGEFHCPECEFTTPVAESSLRRGDFCPECHRGALEHVTE
jgi:ssDNA-binding Zn-finger/Zn-ribbon topoisomerase 1